VTTRRWPCLQTLPPQRQLWRAPKAATSCVPGARYKSMNTLRTLLYPQVQVCRSGNLSMMGTNEARDRKEGSFASRSR
jgi:hypothetical protein